MSIQLVHSVLYVTDSQEASGAISLQAPRSPKTPVLDENHFEFLKTLDRAYAAMLRENLGICMAWHSMAWPF